MIATRRGAAAAGTVLLATLVGCGGGGSDSGAPLMPAATPPSITGQPADASVQMAGIATFSVAATGPNLSYQWRKNGADISGATSASYSAPAATFADNDTQYTVVVSNSNGSATSSVAHLVLVLSPDQQAFENLALAPGLGSYGLHWTLPAVGATGSGDYAYSDYLLLTASPLTNGPQTAVQSNPQDLSATLPLNVPAAQRILKNGTVFVLPSTSEAITVSYVGATVRVDSLASDNTTVLSSAMRSDFQTVPLTGTLKSTPTDFAQWHNVLFQNASLLNQAASWGAGAAYVKYTQTNVGDLYKAFDCKAATAGVNISACATNTTLTAQLTQGQISNSDGTTYHLADGAVSTIGGVSVWVATAPRPQSATLSATVEYRIYFQLGTSVYTGALVKDGAVLGGGSYVSNPTATSATAQYTFLPFFIRMNKAARDSIATAVLF